MGHPSPRSCGGAADGEGQPSPRKPYTIIFSTTTLDGRIASSTGFSELSCPYDKERLYLLRGRADAVMVGANTVVVDDPRLLKRLKPATPRWVRVVVDSKLRVTPEHRIIRSASPVAPVVIGTSRESLETLRAWELASREGVELVPLPRGEGGELLLAPLLEHLASRYGVRLLLVEGGGVLNYHLLAQGLVEEVRITVAPRIFAAGRSVVDDPRGAGFPRGVEARLVGVDPCPCGGEVHLAYKLVEAEPPRRVPVSLAALASHRTQP